MDTATRNIAVDETAQQTASRQSLVESHQGEIWRYLRYLGCENGQAEDLAQETFLIVLRKPPIDLGPAALRSYLRKVARSQFLLGIRKTQRRWTEVELQLAEQVWCEMHPDDGGEEYLTALDGCLEQLEGRAKSAIDMAYREGRSRTDMAGLLEMSEDGVKSLLRRTREILRQCIERKTRP